MDDRFWIEEQKSEVATATAARDPEAVVADSRLDAEVRASPLGWRQRQIIPPLARSVWPLIQEPSGPARKATAAAMSLSADQEVITCRGVVNEETIGPPTTRTSTTGSRPRL